GRRWFVLAFAGFVYALQADWVGFIFAALLLPFLFARGFLLRRWFSPLGFRRFALFWACAACVAVASALLYLLAFRRLGQLDEFLQQGDYRSSGSDLPLGRVLTARRPWIEGSFTPLAIAIGKIALPIIALRALLLRRDGEFLPLIVLATAAIQYVVFKQG